MAPQTLRVTTEDGTFDIEVDAPEPTSEGSTFLEGRRSAAMGEISDTPEEESSWFGAPKLKDVVGALRGDNPLASLAVDVLPLMASGARGFASELASRSKTALGSAMEHPQGEGPISNILRFPGRAIGKFREQMTTGPAGTRAAEDLASIRGGPKPVASHAQTPASDVVGRNMASSGSREGDIILDKLAAERATPKPKSHVTINTEPDSWDRYGKMTTPEPAPRPAPKPPKPEPITMGGVDISKDPQMAELVRQLREMPPASSTLGPETALESPAAGGAGARVSQPAPTPQADPRITRIHADKLGPDDWQELRRMYGSRKLAELTGKTPQEVEALAPGPSRIPLEVEDRMRQMQLEQILGDLRK